MKKLFALLLSVAMVATLFAGVAFAAHTAVLSVNVVGTLAMNQSVTISGSLLPVGGTTLPGAGAGIALQRLAPGDTVWTNVQIFDHVSLSMVNVLPAIGPFSFAHRFTAAGSYRIAFVNAAGAALNSQGAVATPHLVHNLGAVDALPLTITTPTTSLPWGGDNIIRIPLTVTRQAVGGNVVPVLPPAAGATVVENLPANAVTGTFTLTYSGGVITSTYRISGGVVTYEITRGAAALTGTLLVTVTDDTLGWSGQIVINLVARAPFNAVSRLTAAQPVLEAGRLVTFETTVFTGAGAALPLGEYSVTTFSGPIAATAPLVIPGTGAAVPQMGTATANRRVTGLGTITVTTRFYRIHVLPNGTEDHREIGHVVETFPVRAGVVTGVAGGRVGQTVTLTATVTGLDNNPLNTARVVFRATDGSAPFVLRDAVTGLFPADLATAAGVNTVTIDGWALTRNPGLAVANGVYTAEAMLRNVTAASAIVVDVFPLNHTTGQYDLPRWIERTAAGTVLPRLYTSTLSQSTFVTEHRETLTVTIRDAAGNLVTDQLGAPALAHMTATIAPARLEWAAIQVSPGVWSGEFVSSEPGTVRVRMHGVGGNTLNGAEFTVTVVNPRVVVNTSTSRVTSDFFEDITVSLFDPRNDQPIALPLQVRQGAVELPNGATPITAWLETQIPAVGGGFALPVPGNLDSPRATVHTFRALTWATQQHLLGVEQPGSLRYMVTAGGASTAQLFVQTLAPATVELSTSEIRAGVRNNVTLTLRNAHGVAFGSIPQAGVGAAITPAIPREVIASGRWGHTFNMPESGVADLVIAPIGGADGLVAGNIRFDVLSDRPAVLVGIPPVAVPVIALRADMRVTAPLDTTPPVINVTAPATTTEATAQIVINVTDNTAIDRDGISFNGVRIENNQVATFSLVRTVELVLGANNFVVMAQDVAGNNTVHTVTITRTAPPAPPAPPRDTTRPTIEVTAPSITTDASAMLTIVARDNVAVTGVIFEGSAVSVFPGATVTVLRTVSLREGLNSFTLSVADAAGNVAERIIVIERRLPAPAAHVITIGRANPAIGLDVPANVRNGRLMVPFRWFAERILNATVDFKVVGAAEIVTLHRGNMHVELTLNSTIAKVNGVPVALDVAPFATGGRTLVPARFLAETFGYIVNWNPVNDEVTFTVRP